MKKKIIHILCEGQTEEGFVSAVLGPYLRAHGIEAVKTVIAITNRRKGVAGGVVSYAQVKGNLECMYKAVKDDGYARHIFTSMIDFYALPTDFPGFLSPVKGEDRVRAVEKLENAFKDNMGIPDFIPYFQLHEFEALLFCGLEFLIDDYPESRRDIVHLQVECKSFSTPEEINGGVDTAPSKRIIRAVEGNGKTHRYRYNKLLSGKAVTSRIGVDELRRQCPHFNAWVQKILDA